MPHDTLLIAVMVLPFLGSFAAALLPANARNAEAWLAGGIALAGLIMISVIYPAVTGGGVIRHEMRWLPDLGLNFILRMDGLSWMFSVLITGIGFLVVLYARYYIAPQRPLRSGRKIRSGKNSHHHLLLPARKSRA